MQLFLIIFILIIIAWTILIYFAIKHQLSNNMKLFTLVLTIWIVMISLFMYHYHFGEENLFTNSYIINQYSKQYQNKKIAYNNLVSYLVAANVQENVYFYHNVNNETGYDVDIRFIYLIEDSQFQKNANIISNYFFSIGCYKELVYFNCREKNTNHKTCSLVCCPYVEQYYPNCTIYSNGDYPKDTDTNCMYHIEGNWYVRLP